MLGSGSFDRLSEYSVVLIQLVLLLFREELHRGRKDIFFTQVSDIADAVVLEALFPGLDALEQVRFLPVQFDVLLANEVQEFAHLLGRRVVAFFVPPAAWAVLVVLPIVTGEQVLDDGFELGTHALFRSNEFKAAMAVLPFILPDLVRDTTVPFPISDTLRSIDGCLLVHFLGQNVGLSRVDGILPFEEQKTPLGHSQLIFEDSIHDLHLALLVQDFFAEMFGMAPLDIYVEVRWLLMRLIHELVVVLVFLFGLDPLDPLGFGLVLSLLFIVGLDAPGGFH